MKRKEVLKQSLESIIAEHENKLQNYEDFADFITPQIISKMEIALPKIMKKLKKSDKKVRVREYTSLNPWESYDIRKLKVPRQTLIFDVEHMDDAEEYDKEVSLYELLSYQIKGMVLPMLLKKYSLFIPSNQMSFAEYCVQRIDDPDFVSQISNLVYAKKLFNPEKFRSSLFDNNRSEDDIAVILSKLYKYETGKDFVKKSVYKSNKWYNTKNKIQNILEETMTENDEDFRKSFYEAQISMFTVISKIFNKNRQEMGFPIYSLDFNDIASYATLLSEIEKETEDLKQLSTYSEPIDYDMPLERGISNNGFFYGNNKFARIEKREDSLIESVKNKIDFKVIYDGKGKAIDSVRSAFYGWDDNPIYEGRAITSSLVYANEQFLPDAKLLLANKVIAQYAGNQNTSINQQTKDAVKSNKKF